VDVDAQIIRATVEGQQSEFSFEISEFDKALVKAGGWVEFADARY
jgi:3-isopropylmalate/(R)-2-methylmalate dehydratase small subunit